MIGFSRLCIDHGWGNFSKKELIDYEEAGRGPDLSTWSCWTVHVTTDKQFYKQKETVYIMGYVTDHATHTVTPLPEDEITRERRRTIVKKIIDLFCDRDTRATDLVIKSDNGTEFEKKDISLENGTFMVEWKIPEDQKGGEYTIGCYSNPCIYRKIYIQDYLEPHFTLDIKFDKEGYNENDLVSGTISMTIQSNLI